MGDAMTETQGQAAEGRAVEGKAAVRLYLIDRLEAAGLVRPRGVTADAFEKMKAILCDRLSYMDDDNLQTLAESLIEAAPGPQWPSEALVRQWAARLQRPPVTQSRIITSWLTSKEGPEAVARGDLVELYQHLRRFPHPVSEYEMRQIADQAAQNRRRVQIIREKIRDGVASDEDRAWLAARLRLEAEAMALVEQGNAKRAGQ